MFYSHDVNSIFLKNEKFVTTNYTLLYLKNCYLNKGPHKIQFKQNIVRAILVS